VASRLRPRSRLGHSGRSGSAGRLPVQMATACWAVSSHLLAAGCGETTRVDRPTVRVRGSAPLRFAADTGDPVGWPVSSQSVRSDRAGRKTPGRVDETGEPASRPLDAAGVGDGDDRTQQRLAGHAPNTTFAADEFTLDHGRTLRPAGLPRSADGLSDRPRSEYHDVVRQ